MNADNLFAPGQQFYVECIRGRQFTVVEVSENEAKVVDQNTNTWIVEVGETLAFYNAEPGPVNDDVSLTEVHFE